MTLDEICRATPAEIDALVHHHYSDGSPDVPPYSTDWESSSLARQHHLGVKGLITAGGTATMSLYRDGRGLEIGASAELTECEEQRDPPKIFAPLAARAPLKLLVYRPDLCFVQGL